MDAQDFMDMMRFRDANPELFQQMMQQGQPPSRPSQPFMTDNAELLQREAAARQPRHVTDYEEYLQREQPVGRPLTDYEEYLKRQSGIRPSPFQSAPAANTLPQRQAPFLQWGQ